ncbi:MAG: sugar transporter permease [Stenotrophomonas indicatrix]|uniref:carbohydrate ABC transporter permease n=1 Tax=Stenotrophomonas indicatrix TaxID=2045451 RepID=UPI00242F3359|nr:sugar ABC transporter permease [Stenotrophomonas indicatrix]MDF2483614.1 sugar transporter permease [Stenotrophomonas indicatrix]
MKRTSLAGWIFAGPSLIVLGVFFGLPVASALALSVTDFDLYALADSSNLRFVGLGNYIDLLQTPMFWKSLWNTTYFVVIGVPLSIGVSLGAAMLLNAPAARFKALFRTALFAPVVTTLVAVAVIWRYLFWAMPTIMLFAVWKNFGYNMVIFLAGLQAIPHDLYEAARIDGASRWKQFLHITLPMLGPVLLVVGVITVSGYFQLFAEPYVMTRGDPLQSTVSVLYFMFEEGFKWWNLGRASAVAFLLFLIILAVTTVMLRFGRKRQLV